MKTKNVILLFLIAFCAVKVSAQSATWVKNPCDCPREDENIINIVLGEWIPGEGGQITFTAAPAQAYQWEICGEFGSIISGENSQTVVTNTNPNILENYAVSIYLTRFENGECEEICIYKDFL